MKKTAGKFILFLSILGSIATIFLFSYLFRFSLKYWINNFPLGYPTEYVAFYVAMFVAITTIIFEWVDGRIKSIIQSIRDFKKLKGGVSNESRRSGSQKTKRRN